MSGENCWFVFWLNEHSKVKQVRIYTNKYHAFLFMIRKINPQNKVYLSQEGVYKVLSNLCVNMGKKIKRRWRGKQGIHLSPFDIILLSPSQWHLRKSKGKGGGYFLCESYLKNTFWATEPLRFLFIFFPFPLFYPRGAYYYVWQKYGQITCRVKNMIKRWQRGGISHFSPCSKKYAYFPP